MTIVIINETNVTQNHVAQEIVRLLMTDDDDCAEREQPFSDEVEGLVTHESLTTTGEEHGVIDDKVGTVTA